MSDVRWFRCPGGEECPLAVDPGPHEHSVNEDGTVGAMVRRVPMTVGDLAAALVALGPEVQDYVVWHEADPASDVQAGDIRVLHERRTISF